MRYFTPPQIHLVNPVQITTDRDRHFNLSLDLLCIAGIDGYFKQVNPSWTRILGWSESELLSRPVVDLIHPEDRDRTLQARANLAKGILLSGFENRYLCKDGTYRWLSWQSSVEPGASTVFGVARDITERRRLDHEHLIASKLESTGILAGGIAHDFNNLLAGLMLNLDMITLTGLINPDQEIFLHQAQECTRAARVLARQLIMFAHGENSVRQPRDLRTLLQKSLDTALSGSPVQGQLELAPDLWPAMVDEDQIDLVIRQVVLNAREAMPAGGTVSLSAKNLEGNRSPGPGGPAENQVQITVTDEGTGIPPDLLPKVFDPYFSTKQRGTQKGMGLGLTICHTVIKKHGGVISIDSQPERGTTVTIRLPAAPSPSAMKPDFATTPRQTEDGRLLL